MKPAAEKRWIAPAICLGLVAITFLVFGQTRHFEFVNYDDDRCVYENPTVAQGLTMEGVISAFARGNYGNWIPGRCFRRGGAG